MSNNGVGPGGWGTPEDPRYQPPGPADSGRQPSTPPPGTYGGQHHGSGNYGGHQYGGQQYGGQQYGGPTASAPVCPRHPDRVSYVTCQRCNRPACPECQRQATVGVQCVDCVKQAQRAAPGVRTVLGGRARAGAPVITYAIMAICILIEALRYISPPLYQVVFQETAFLPILGSIEPWRMLTTTLLHGSLMHLAFNMYALYLVGGQLEQLLGRTRFIALYVVSGFAGSVAYVLIAGTGAPTAVGASGAVFGLFGAYVLVARRLNRQATGMIAVLGINAVIGFVLPNIAWQAHLGGLLAGAAIAAGFAYAPRERRWLGWLALAAVTVVLLGVTAAIYGV